MHKHASKREALRCNELTLLERQGEIKFLKQQPIITLQPKFKLRGKAIRAITYIADFSYYEPDKRRLVIEDTKGFKTKDYKIKAKMLQYLMEDRNDFLFLES